MNEYGPKRTPKPPHIAPAHDFPGVHRSARGGALRAPWLRNLLFLVLFVGLSAGVPYAIYHELGGEWPTLDGRLWTPAFLTACLALLLVYFVSDGLRLWFVIRALGYRLPARQMTPLVFLNILITNLSPLGAGGGVAQIWYLRRLGMHTGAATAAATLRTLLASLGIFIPALLLLWFWPTLAGRVLSPGWSFALGLLAALYLGGFALAYWQLRGLLNLTGKTLAWLARRGWLSPARQERWYRICRRELVRFAMALRCFAGSRGPDVWLAVVSTAVFLLALFSVPALLLYGLGHAVPYATSLSLSAITTFAMYFAPTPGGAGVAEGLFGLLFAGYVASADLLLLVLGWRFLTVHLGMLLGVPVLLHVLWRGGPHAA